MRQIDADALRKKALPYTLERGGTLGRHTWMADLFLELIDAAPTIDAEPVRHGWWEDYPNSAYRWKAMAIIGMVTKRHAASRTQRIVQ